MSMTKSALLGEPKEMLRKRGEKGGYDSIIRSIIEEVRKRLDNRWNKILIEDEFTPLDEP